MNIHVEHANASNAWKTQADPAVHYVHTQAAGPYAPDATLDLLEQAIETSNSPPLVTESPAVGSALGEVEALIRTLDIKDKCQLFCPPKTPVKSSRAIDDSEGCMRNIDKGVEVYAYLSKEGQDTNSPPPPPHRVQQQTPAYLSITYMPLQPPPEFCYPVAIPWAYTKSPDYFSICLDAHAMKQQGGFQKLNAAYFTKAPYDRVEITISDNRCLRGTAATISIPLSTLCTFLSSAADKTPPAGMISLEQAVFKYTPNGMNFYVAAELGLMHLQNPVDGRVCTLFRLVIDRKKMQINAFFTPGHLAAFVQQN